jgi:hypothetical protein
MILPFSTKLNGKPTCFVEKIHSGLIQNDLMRIFDMDLAHEDFDTGVLVECHPKLHTIREDKNDRWKEGNEIHFFINCRQPNMFRFAPVLPVVSIQKVFMTYTFNDIIEISIDDNYVNNVLEFAINDGFDTWEDFFNFFYPKIKENPNHVYKGKIIHWTNKKY